MSLDDRMQAAFNDRTHSLETTMTPTNPLDPSAAASGTTSMFSAVAPWAAVGAGALALFIGASTLLGGGDDNTVITDQPTTTESVDAVADADEQESTEGSTPVTTSPDTGSSTSAANLGSTSTVPQQTSTVAASATCTAPGYTVTVPAGWSHDGCVPFSPAAIPAPGPFEFRPEIDLAYSAETYPQALARINSTLTILSSSTTTVDGLDATIFVIEEDWFDLGERTVYVVDGGTGVFFASGNELVDSAAIYTDRAAHYAETLVVLDAMMATADVTYSAPVAKVEPACVAPTFTNPVNGIAIQADIDGDGSIDTAQMVQHDDGVSIVVDAGTNGFYEALFANSDPLHVSNDIVAVDLDANGEMEILGSAMSGPTGNNYEAFFLDGCDLAPVGGVAPRLVQRASVTNVNSFECNVGAHGKVQLDTDETILDQASGNFDHTGDTYNFDGSAFVLLASTSTTSPNPIQLAGPSSCG